MSVISYRLDIDGLRALAVLAVVLYHAGVPGFSGGFVGVDVFFVISGYLMASIIRDALNEGRFSWAAFAAGRIRRLLPMQAVVIASILLASGILYFPEDFWFAAKQGMAQTISVSNLFYYAHIDYFNDNHLLMPFLHFWSLSLEVQFYAIFSILLWAIARFSRGHEFKILVGILLLSLTACIWMTGVDKQAAFYRLPFRLWEFLMGAIIVFHGRAFAGRLWEKEIVCLIALAAMLASFALMGHGVPFPGFSAAIPCAGAAILIWVHQGTQTHTRRILCLRPLVFTGLVSYSLYLWHWPLFTIAAYVSPEWAAWPIRILLAVVALALAALSWKYIEIPFRNPQRFTVAKTFPAALCAFCALVAICGGIMAYGTMTKQRLAEVLVMNDIPSVDKNPYRGCEREGDKIARGDLCQTNPGKGIEPSFIMWGDSLAQATAVSFFDLSKKYSRNGYVVFRPDCGPFMDHYQQGAPVGPFCRSFNKEIMAFAKRKGVKDVFLVANWQRWFENPYIKYDSMEWYDAYKGRYSNIVVAGAQRTIDELHRAGKKVHVVISPPVMSFDATRLAAIEKKYGTIFSKAYLPLSVYKEERARYLDGFIAANRGDARTEFLDSMPLFCPEDKCWAVIDGKPVYIDNAHISLFGNEIIKPLFEPYFEKGF